MTITEQLERATQLFETAVEGLEPADWDRPTPCSEWSVRDLVNHVTSELLWAPPLVAGQTIEQVGSKFDGDVTGDDPIAIVRTAGSSAVMGFRADGALNRIVHLSFGDFKAAEYCAQITTDLIIHTWDLTAALGRPKSFDAELVKLATDTTAPMAEGGRAAGVFGSEVTVSDEATPQAKLLALTGRDPAWKPA